MDIKVLDNWLKEFLTTDAPPQKIAECLSLCGPSVEQLEKTKDDYVYHLEVTTNRVDMMSVLGIAREAAAILPQFGYKARFKTSGTLPEVDQTGSFPLEIKVNHQLCPRFSAVVINNVTIKPSPPKIKERLEKSGIRSLNNVVDISNYLMRAYGQPVHTFDCDKIKDKMILRLSRKGETLTTLDGKTFTLPGEDIVIEDGSKRLIDLCGIMGGANSAVDANTKKVLLFVQTYSAKHIRRTSMILGQRSEAAQIFEKQPDPEQIMSVLLKGIQLFKQLTGGAQSSKIIDIYPQPDKPKSVTAPLQLIKERLGVEITQPEVDKILKSLGFINNQVPSWRAKDINIPEDIVEEVARIYGYHRLPSQIMATAIPTNYPETNFYLEQQIKHWLVGFGLTEIYTNSLIGQNYPGQLKIKNALNMTANKSRENRGLSTQLVSQSFNTLMKDITLLRKYYTPLSQTIKLQKGKEQLSLLNLETKEFKWHPVVTEDFSKSRYLEKILWRLCDQKPENYEKLLATPGVGPKTIRALALVAEVIYGAKPSYEDPARYSFAHGGKDATPYPVDRQTYDQTIEKLKSFIKN